MMQTTIGKTVFFEGAGVFSGNKVKLTISPAKTDTGIVFIRTDLPHKPIIPATIEHAETRFHHTCLVKDNAVVETVEHFLAAIHGVGIDNLEISMDNTELPVGDGSAKLFVELLKSAEIVSQDIPKKVFVLKNPMAVQTDKASIVAIPAENGQLKIDYTLEYNSPLIGVQHLSVNITPEIFANEIAPSRSFCLSSEIEEYTKRGLGKGASYENTIIIDKTRVVNNTLRFPDEFVRHKILDITGDIYLLGSNLVAHIIAIKSGHDNNLQLVQKLNNLLNSTQIIASSKRETLLDVREIQNILPHRYPFLLIDKVIKMEGYSKAVGIKNVTINEPYFQGHFPGQPVMPAVLQIESMAQLSGALLMRKSGNENKLGVLLAIDGVKFRKSIVPGDQLIVETETVRFKTRTAELHAKILVDGELASEADLKFMLVDKN
jgi:UDP-3-O-[3-hydroxymyristoyl] N-acetylglucosamine deacetylase/3-hydroxyacyl-[acyl-carrier-protein] dehydratase